MRLKHSILTLMMTAFLVVSCVDRITPVESTKSAIGETFVRISIYAATNMTVPLSLDVLPKRDGYSNQITDGWGRPLEYRVTQDGIMTLTSLGRNGKPGGNGEDADMAESYFAKRPDGSLWVGSDMWIVEGRVR